MEKKACVLKEKNIKTNICGQKEYFKYRTLWWTPESGDKYIPIGLSIFAEHLINLADIKFHTGTVFVPYVPSWYVTPVFSDKAAFI